MPALAPPAAVAPPPRGRVPEVSTVVVTAPTGEVPALASSWPAQGAAVAPGTMVLKIAFSTAMTPSRWAYGPAPGAPYPRCLDRPRLLADQRTFVLLCVTAGKGPWTVRLNPKGLEGGEAGEHGAFAGAGGRPLPQVDLSFTTTDERPTTSLDEAMKAASLADDQGPVMDDRAQGGPGEGGTTGRPSG